MIIVVGVVVRGGLIESGFPSKAVGVARGVGASSSSSRAKLAILNWERRSPKLCEV